MNKKKQAISSKGRTLLLTSPVLSSTDTSQYGRCGYLAFATFATLLEERWNVQILNPRSEWEFRAALKPAPAVVGITSTSPEYPHAKRTAQMAYEETDGRAVIIIGGAHQKSGYRETLEDCAYFDAAFVGEADISFPQFLESDSAVPGIAYRQSGSVVYPGRVPVLLSAAQLNRISFPRPVYLHGLDDFIGSLFDSPVARLMSQRGCNYRCAFCASSEPMRQYAVERVIEYVRELMAEGFKVIYFEDSTFTLDEVRTARLLRGLIRLKRETNADIQFGTQTRLDRLNDRLIDLLKLAGFTYLYVGVESFDDLVLQNLRKRMTAGEAVSRVQRLKDAGIRVGAPISWFPVATEDSFMHTIRVLRELKPYLIFFEFPKIYPGTDWAREHPLGERHIVGAYTRGIRETAELENPEDRGTYICPIPGEVSVAMARKAYAILETELGGTYKKLSAGCYQLV